MLVEGFRAAAPAAKQQLLKSLDRKYAGFKLLQKASDNPEAIGTLATRARANSNRIDRDFHDLVTSYQDVLLRGYPQSSGTAENMAIGNMLSTLAHTARAGTAKTSRAYEDIRSKLVPAPRQRAPRQRKFNAAVKRGTDPILRALQGATPFVIGQQSPGTALEALPASLIR
jgi:hypothetical protein